MEVGSYNKFAQLGKCTFLSSLKITPPYCWRPLFLDPPATSMTWSRLKNYIFYPPKSSYFLYYRSFPIYTYDVMYIFCFVHKVENRIEDLNNKTNCHLLNTQCKVSWGNTNTCPVLFRKHNSKTIFLLISWWC